MKTEAGEERTPGKLQNDIVTNNKFFKQPRSWQPFREISEQIDKGKATQVSPCIGGEGKGKERFP